MDALLRNLEHKPLLFVGGKGGVGKTTHAASLACRLADLGRKVLLISTDPAHSLGDVLQTPLSGTVRALTPYLSALELNPQQMVDKHFAQVADTVAAYAQPQMLPQLKQHLEAAKASPGAEEAAMLEAMCRYIVHYRIMGFEQIVFDTAPTGHTLRLLSLPQMMEAWSEGLLAQQGRQQRLREAALPFWRRSAQENTVLDEAKNQRWQQALQVLQKRRQLFAQAGELLSNPQHTAIVLVMVPEMLPLAETRRAVAQLQHFELPCRHLIVNQIMPAPEPDNDFWQQRYARQQEILAQIRTNLAGLQQHEYGLQTADIRGIEALSRFGVDGILAKSSS